MHLKTAITLQKFTNATMYSLYYYYYYWLKDLSSDQNGTVWSVGIISFSGKFTPLETASSTHCNEDGLRYTVNLITK